MQEKFSITEVAMLMRELRHASLDSFQSGDAIRAFVTDRGYGISKEHACGVAKRVEGPRENLESLHQELETLALMM